MTYSSEWTRIFITRLLLAPPPPSHVHLFPRTSLPPKPGGGTGTAWALFCNTQGQPCRHAKYRRHHAFNCCSPDPLVSPPLTARLSPPPQGCSSTRRDITILCPSCVTSLTRWPGLSSTYSTGPRDGRGAGAHRLAMCRKMALEYPIPPRMLSYPTRVRLLLFCCLITARIDLLPVFFLALTVLPLPFPLLLEFPQRSAPACARQAHCRLAVLPTPLAALPAALRQGCAPLVPPPFLSPCSSCPSPLPALFSRPRLRYGISPLRPHCLHSAVPARRFACAAAQGHTLRQPFTRKATSPRSSSTRGAAASASYPSSTAPATPTVGHLSPSHALSFREVYEGPHSELCEKELGSTILCITNLSTALVPAARPLNHSCAHIEDSWSHPAAPRRYYQKSSGFLRFGGCACMTFSALLRTHPVCLHTRALSCWAWLPGVAAQVQNGKRQRLSAGPLPPCPATLQLRCRCTIRTTAHQHASPFVSSAFFPRRHRTAEGVGPTRTIHTAKQNGDT